MAGNKLGSWSFIVGLLLAVVLGVGWAEKYHIAIVWVVFLMGIIVGIFNVTAKETQAFLTAGTILALIAYLGINVGVFADVMIIQNILRSILTLFIPSTIIVALKAVYELAKD